ncbi:NDR1/HIN1-like protein 13 [Curcuma longa]|uniref:NDR1/HIN1-like protein 13 n=1 Tax=Curcuma longa TaxID=136217 RepID=UPI003D9E8A44
MAEQAAVRPCRPPLPSPAAGHSLHHPTYVVQIPKDQIYRVPPAENAALVEHYRNQENFRRQRHCRCLRFLERLLPVLLPLLLITAAVVAFFASVNPSTPTFVIKSLAIKNSSRSVTEYDFAVRISNPSNRIGLAYGGGGRVAASHDGKEIATGATSGFYQPQGKSTDLKVVLRGSSNTALKASKKGLRIELMANFSVNPKVGGLELWRRILAVNCDVKVTELDKNKKVHISSQDCSSKLHS